jgi:hypothetical protein
MTLAVKIISVYEAGWQGFTSWYELWVWNWIFHRRMKTRLALIDIQATSAKLLRPLNPQLHKVRVIPEPHPVNLYQQFSPQRASSERHHSGCRIRSCTSSRRGNPSDIAAPDAYNHILVNQKAFRTNWDNQVIWILGIDVLSKVWVNSARVLRLSDQHRPQYCGWMQPRGATFKRCWDQMVR